MHSDCENQNLNFKITFFLIARFGKREFLFFSNEAVNCCHIASLNNILMRDKFFIVRI